MIAALLLAQVMVSWSWTSEIQENGFEVERSPAGCTSWTVIARPPANIMSIQDIDMPGNCYRVRAFDGSRFYPYSNIGVVPAQPPTCRPRGKSGKCK